MNNKTTNFAITLLITIVLLFTATTGNALTITQTQILKFGNFVAGSTQGNITIYPDGSTTHNGIGYFEGNTQRAVFNVQGNANTSYNITLPTNDTVQLENGNNNVIFVNDFTSNPSAVGTLDNTGKQLLQVGATLQIKANQPSGSYNGTYQITVAYQ